MKTSPGYIIVLHLYTTNDNHINVSLLKYGVQQTAFFVIWSIFYPFTHLPVRKIKILEKCLQILPFDTNDKTSYDIRSLRYEVQLTEFIVNSSHFCPFTQLATGKFKILKKWKQFLEISSFYASVPKIMIICYTFPEIWQVTDVIFIFHLLPLYPLNSPKN